MFFYNILFLFSLLIISIHPKKILIVFLNDYSKYIVTHNFSGIAYCPGKNNHVFHNIYQFYGDYFTVLDDRRHNTIGPTIASNKIILATNSHNEPYVYNP